MSDASKPVDGYWALDLPGLTKGAAQTLVSAAADLGFPGSAVDPANFLTLHIDRDTALTLRASLEAAPEAVRLPALVEILGAWIDEGRSL